MALNATLFRISLQVSDLDRQHYGNYALTVVRHPSETDLRMMLRIVAFAQHAHEDLAFTRGLSTSDEPDLWRHDATGDIIEWIELGTPDSRRVRKGCSGSRRMVVYSYQDRRAAAWWRQAEPELARFTNLSVHHIPERQSQPLNELAQRNMSLTHTHQDGTIWLADERQTVVLTPEHWKTSP